MSTRPSSETRARTLANMPDRLNSQMQVVLKRNNDKYLRRGYPWVFSNQIQHTTGDPKSGDVVHICGSEGRTYGLGLYHSDSIIGVRFLTTDTSREINRDFFLERIRAAAALRTAAFPGDRHYRLVFSESDGMPGTVIDRYGEVYSWTTICYGMDIRANEILDALEEVVRPEAVIERNDSWLRTKDGLEEQKSVLRGSYSGPVSITENDIQYLVDVMDGPKTGFFLDQRWNRQIVRKFAKDRRVLDVFSADGGFGLHAAAGGARSVTVVDISEAALRRAAENADRSQVLDKLSFVEADALNWLGEEVAQHRRYDLVILDPPAFAKSRRHVEMATSAYQRININAMQLLEDGGILATGSCSHAIDENEFLKIIRYCARRSGTALRLLYRGGQPPDHPILPSMPETSYLKFFVFQKIGELLPEEPEE